MRSLLFSAFLILIGSCAPPERDCKQFQEGTFRFDAIVNGQEETTIFTRSKTLEVSEHLGKVDSASIRWINDCEYIVTNLNPQGPGEEKPIHMKILSTTGDSYTFEYKFVGSSKSSRGTAYKME
ncbi:MAG: DNA topoisomerase IV [Robiginitalea sp.]|nr:DNA topoisomerase IV [Robiginitalea sp.]